MASADHTASGTAVTPPQLDPASAEWVRTLTGFGAEREAALARLHEMLLRIARRETRRRSGQLQISGPELDDLAYQATADTLLAIIGKLGQFRGESRFTTWAYKFVIFEVSAKSSGISGAARVCR
jgi:RNA polymerase sigma-70 factor, ECF subfamily